MSEVISEGLSGLVNRLTQEVAQVRRELATASRKLGTASRTLDGRTQELTEAKSALALLLATLDCTSDGLVAMGYFGRAMHFNQRFIDMWRIPPDKVASLSDDSLLAMQLAQVRDPQSFLAVAVARKAQPDSEQRAEVELTDGRILECHVMPQRVNNKRIGSVTSYRDITQTVRMKKALDACAAQLDAA